MATPRQKMEAQPLTRASNPFLAVLPRERAAILGLVALLGLLISVLNLLHARTDLFFVLLATLAYLGVLTLPLLLYRQAWGWFHPMIFLPVWVLATSVLPSFAVYVGGLERHSALPGASVEDLNHLVVEALLLQSAGWLVFYAGFTTRQIRTMKFNIPEPRIRTTPMKIFLLAGISSIGLLVLADAAGGLDQLLMQRGRPPSERVAAELGGHWSLLASEVLPVGCLAWLALRPQAVRTALFWLIFGGGLFMSFAATGSRSSVIIPVIMALAIWALRSGRMPYAGTLLLAVAAIAALGILGDFRAQTWAADDLDDVTIESNVLKGFMGGFDERMTSSTERSALIGILGRVPDEVGHLYGRSYLSIPAAAIPSQLWPDKPPVGGRLSGQLIFGRGPDGGAVPPGTTGEAYWNFHIPGVIIVFFLWGRLSNWLASFYRAHSHHSVIAVLYVLTLFSFAPNSGSLYGWFHGMVAAVFALVLFCGRPRLMRRRQRSAPGSQVADGRSGRD